MSTQRRKRRRARKPPSQHDGLVVVEAEGECICGAVYLVLYAGGEAPVSPCCSRPGALVYLNPVVSVG
jgi:hypothetical protein